MEVHELTQGHVSWAYPVGRKTVKLASQQGLDGGTASLTPLALRSLKLLAERDDSVAHGVAASDDCREQPSSNVGLDPLTYRLCDSFPRHLVDGVLGHRDLLEPSGWTGVGSKRFWKPVIGSNQEVRDFSGFWVACVRCRDELQRFPDATNFDTACGSN